MPNEKRKKRFSYLKDYILNDNGEYEYHGQKYFLDLSKEDRKKALIKLLVVYILLLFFVCLSGLLPFKGMMNTFYIIIPYIFEFLLTLMLIPIVFNICRNNEFKAYQFEKNIGRIKPYSGIIMVNSLIGFIGSTFFIYLNGYEPLLITILFIFAKIMTFVLSKRLIKTIDLLIYKAI